MPPGSFVGLPHPFPKTLCFTFAAAIHEIAVSRLSGCLEQFGVLLAGERQVLQLYGDRKSVV